MKTGSAHSLFAIGLLVLFALAGCGQVGLTSDAGSSTGGVSGGGQIVAGVGSGGTGVVTAARREPVVDSGMIGAVVFIDKNGNRLPDADEPFAFTDQNGSYNLPLDPVEAAAHPLLLQAVQGATIVKATGQVVTSTYVVELGPQPGGN